MSEKFEQEAIDAYQYNRQDNLTENGVLTVTITLHEYRELVSAKAKEEQRQYDSENWKLRQEVDRLKQQIVDLTFGTEQEGE